MGSCSSVHVPMALLTCPLLLSMMLLQFLLSDIFPEVINHKIVKPVFAVVVLLLFVAPQVGAYRWLVDQDVLH